MLQFLPALLAILFHGVSTTETARLDHQWVRAMVAVHQLPPQAALALLEESENPRHQGELMARQKPSAAWWALIAKVAFAPVAVAPLSEESTIERSPVLPGRDVSLPSLLITDSSRSRDGPR
jgi:hypothetical protein